MRKIKMIWRGLRAVSKMSKEKQKQFLEAGKSISKDTLIRLQFELIRINMIKDIAKVCAERTHFPQSDWEEFLFDVARK